MRLTPAATPPAPVPADPTPIATIEHPYRRVPPSDVALDSVVPDTSWASLADAIAGAQALTRSPLVPMVALLRDATTGAIRAWHVLADAMPAPDTAKWGGYYLENAVRVAGPAVVDWAAARPDLLAFVDGAAVLTRDS